MEDKSQPPIFSWQDGRYFDLWIIPHTLSGVSFGFLSVLLGIGGVISYPVAIVILVGWEVIEYLFDIAEDVSNQAVDVVVGILGFSAAYEISVTHLDAQTTFILFGIAVLLAVPWSVVGWIKFLREWREK